MLGKRLFTANCSACHQATGAGVPGQYPPLAGSEWVQGEPARVKRIVLVGLEGPVTVKGAIHNGNMPNFGIKLKDEQIAAILTYVRTNKEWGNDAGPISAAEVAATRAAVKERIVPWAASELMAISRDDGASAAPVRVPPATAPATAPAAAVAAPSRAAVPRAPASAAPK